MVLTVRIWSGMGATVPAYALKHITLHHHNTLVLAFCLIFTLLLYFCLWLSTQAGKLCPEAAKILTDVSSNACSLSQQ